LGTYIATTSESTGRFAVVTQLSVANGEPLFEVEYGDE
jgi:hypothetical protein